MIVSLARVGVAAIADLAGRCGKNIPDRAAAAVFVDRALDLVGRRCRAPDKAFWEKVRLVRVLRRTWSASAAFAGESRHAKRGQAGELCELPACKLRKHRFPPMAYGSI